MKRCVEEGQLRNMAHLHDLIKFYFVLRSKQGEILLLWSTVDDNYAYTTKDFKHSLQKQQEGG